MGLKICMTCFIKLFCFVMGYLDRGSVEDMHVFLYNYTACHGIPWARMGLKICMTCFIKLFCFVMGYLDRGRV